MSTIQPPFPAYQGSEPYVFISYAHADSVAVLPLITQLHSRGYRIWYDEGIDPGTEFAKVIAGHLKNAVVVLLFVTPVAVERPFVRREINFAQNRGIPIVSIILSETILPDELELQLGLEQMIFKYRYPEEASFFEVLLRSPHFGPCLGQTNVVPSRIYAIGGTVELGAIEWTVLTTDEENRKALLITKEVIGRRPYHESYEAVTWDSCGLRACLGHMYEKFSPEEQSRIDGEFFLLSSEEVIKYFAAQEIPAGEIYDATVLSLFPSTVFQIEPPGSWWLRSPGSDAARAAYVDVHGVIDCDGKAVTESCGVRPALWLKQ